MFSLMSTNDFYVTVLFGSRKGLKPNGCRMWLNRPMVVRAKLSWVSL